MNPDASRTAPAVAVATLALIAVAWASPQDGGQANDRSLAIGESDGMNQPEVVRILAEMGDHLKMAREFSFHAEIEYDSVLTSGRKIQYGGVGDVWVRRPDRLRARFDGDEKQRRSFYNGKTFTIYDVRTNTYAVTEVPPDIDGAMDYLFEEYGFTVPIADFLYADPFEALIPLASDGYIVGLHEVDGTPCHHLAFAQDLIDWQIWIEDGPRPVPRKLVITYKDEPGSPQWAARLSDWRFEPVYADHFDFNPPEGAARIEFLPIPADEPAEYDLMENEQ